jgi:hypothetical protein
VTSLSRLSPTMSARRMGHPAQTVVLSSVLFAALWGVPCASPSNAHTRSRVVGDKVGAVDVDSTDEGAVTGLTGVVFPVSAPRSPSRDPWYLHRAHPIAGHSQDPLTPLVHDVPCVAHTRVKCRDCMVDSVHHFLAITLAAQSNLRCVGALFQRSSQDKGAQH